MGPQEQAFRSGVDVIIATPGRLLDHFQHRTPTLRDSRSWCSTRRTGCSTWASCRTSAACSSTCPSSRQTLFFSATMPARSRRCRARCCGTRPDHVERKAAPAGHRQALYPVREDLKAALPWSCFGAGRWGRHRVHPHEAPRQPARGELEGRGSRTRRSTATVARRSARRRWTASRPGRSAAGGDGHRRARHRRRGAGARGELRRAGVPEDYIHRVGRTARAEATGDAFTFVAPEEERTWRDRAGDRQGLPRVTLPGLRLREQAEKLRDPDRGADRGDPRAEGRGPQAFEEKAGEEGCQRGRAGERREAPGGARCGATERWGRGRRRRTRRAPADRVAEVGGVAVARAAAAEAAPEGAGSPIARPNSGDVDSI